MDTTFDGLLNRRITVEQPATGFRIAIDTILLAAAVPARTGQKAADFGCGAGGAMLALACRVDGVSVTGIEIQPELVELCRRNIALNGFQDRLDVQAGDVAALGLSESFDHVFTNPPYHDEARHDLSPLAIKRTANSGQASDLGLWVTRAAAALKEGGSLTIIHRADELDAILKAATAFSRIEILPLLPAAGAPPKRVIVRAWKGDAISAPRHCHPLVLHKPEGGYTDEAENILRHAEALAFR